MNMKKKMELCAKFFEALGEVLQEDYDMIGSCNHDSSVYLVPKGTSDQNSYYGKPTMSFRMSDHWNWYSSLKRCEINAMVQCCSLDMPWAKQRPEEGVASDPIRAAQVAIYGKDKRYHHIFGEKYDRKHRRWTWEEMTIPEVVGLLKT